MSTVQEIEKAIERLPRNEFLELEEWLVSKFSDEWDLAIEEDVKSGRLDTLAQEAISKYRAGKTTLVLDRQSH